MPIYHSVQINWAGAVSCGSALLPLRTKVKGPAPSLTNANEQDIIDEAIYFFRANVLFRNFQTKGPADLTLAYLTIFIGEVLRFVAKYKTKEEARRNLTQISMSASFAVPGERNFCLPGFFSQPTSKQDGDQFRAYYRQAREECANRVLDVAFTESGAPNKWWLAFSKRKFMNIAST